MRRRYSSSLLAGDTLLARCQTPDGQEGMKMVTNTLIHICKISDYVSHRLNKDPEPSRVPYLEGCALQTLYSEFKVA